MTILKVRAHWTGAANPVPPSIGTYGTPPTMATAPPAWPPTPVGPVPPASVYHVWCPLVAQADLDSAQWGTNTVSPPPQWPVASGAAPGTFDQGYGAAAIDFNVTGLRLWLDGELAAGLTYTITAPNGTVVGSVTSLGPGWTTVPLAAPINSGKGIWRIDINRSTGSTAPQPGLVTGAPPPAGVNEPYVTRFANNKLDGVLGLEFTGDEVIVTCRDIKVTGPSTACLPSGQSVTVTFTASFTPATPPYTGTVYWQVRDGSGNIVPIPPPVPTGPTLTFTFTQKGQYKVTASIIQMGCQNVAPSDTDVINIVDCTCPSIIGSPGGIQVTNVNSCTFGFSVQINNPSGATPTFTWDFGDGTGPHPGPSSITYTYAPLTTGTKKVTVTLTNNDPTCSDSATTQVTVQCGSTTPTTTTTTTTTTTPTPTTTTTTTTTTTPTPTTTSTPTSTSTGGPFGLCGFVLLLALILLGIAAVGLAVGGCLGPAGAGMMVGAIPIAASGLAVLGLWMLFCPNCPLMRFLQRFFGVMALVMLGLSAVLALLGVAGCSAGAAAVATLFGAIVGALSIGIAVLRCP